MENPHDPIGNQTHSLPGGNTVFKPELDSSNKTQEARKLFQM
jgi:hypothetical protein